MISPPASAWKRAGATTSGPIDHTCAAPDGNVADTLVTPGNEPSSMRPRSSVASVTLTVNVTAACWNESATARPARASPVSPSR